MITPSVWDSFNLILQINFKESLQLMMFYTKDFNCYTSIMIYDARLVYWLKKLK